MSVDRSKAIGPCRSGGARFGALAAAVVVAWSSSVAAQSTWRVSARSDGVQVSADSSEPSISSDGRVIAFASAADDLVDGDTNGASDVFVHDRSTGRTTRVSVGIEGEEARGDSRAPSISTDGRYVAFESRAPNLDGYGIGGIFVHDRTLGDTTLVSVDSSGRASPIACFRPSISGDGRFVAFECGWDALVPGDANGQIDVLVHDRVTCATTIVSRNRLGRAGNAPSTSPSISFDGRFVAFTSAATNLVFGDTNGERDVFVFDRRIDALQRVSVSSENRQADGASYAPSISADGRFVAFTSDAVVLLPRPRGPRQVFVRDRLIAHTRAVSVDSHGRLGNRPSNAPSISPDGRFVAFTSAATNLVDGDTNGFEDVFLHDVEEYTTLRVDVSERGEQAQAPSYAASVSSGGECIAFVSRARNLTCGDTNNAWDVFVRELVPTELPERVYHVDRDGDGFGNPVQSRVASDLEAGFVLDASDCDDMRADVHPGADERFNGLDDDCDGATDEEFVRSVAPAERSALGCAASLRVRAPDDSAGARRGEFVVQNARNQALGFVACRLASAVPFADDRRFVRSGFARARGSTSMADCSGTVEVAARGAAYLPAGSALRARFVARDLENGRSALSDELWFVLAP
ncbi:MAG: MopE-related protein [Planctomycetota bacterium]